MRIGLKLTAAFLLVASLVGAAGYMAQHTSTAVQQQMERLSRSAIVKVADTMEITVALYASQLASHALLVAERSTPNDPSAEAAGRHGLVEEHLKIVEAGLDRQRLAAESLIRWATAQGITEVVQRETDQTLPTLNRLADEFAQHRRLQEQFLAMLPEDDEQAEQFLNLKLCQHAETHVLPLLSEYRQRAERELTGGIRTTERAMVVANQQRGLLLVAAAVCAVLMGLFVSRSIGSPLQALQQAAAEVGKGRFDVRVAIRRRDEIGMLAAEVNQMAADLKATTVSKAQLLASLEEKELLLKEVHHRVKNNLQVISSLLSLQSKELDDPAIARLFQESQGRIRSMALIHEQLYRSSDLARIDFAAYVEDLVGHLQQSLSHKAAPVKFLLNVQPIPLPLDLAIPCGMIVNELVSNALQHAFPHGQAGEIKVMFTQNPAGYCLAVADNGVGMNAGRNDSEPTSLGLRVVEALTRQVHGNLEVRRSGGTAFEIQFQGESPPSARDESPVPDHT